MVIVKFQTGEQIAYLSNDEKAFGEVKVYGKDGSENLQNFLKAEMSKRLLMFSCGYSNVKREEIESKIKEDFKEAGRYIKRDKDNILKIDTTDDNYIIDYLIDEVCASKGIKATIIDQA